LQYVDIIGG